MEQADGIKSKDVFQQVKKKIIVSDKNLMTAIKGKAIPVAGYHNINVCRFNNMPVDEEKQWQQRNKVKKIDLQEN